MSSATSGSVALDEQAKRLVEENLSLVRQVAGRWRAHCRSHVEFADLVQVGTLGLIDAARRFDPSRHAAFHAFAAQRIGGAIRDSLRELDPLTRKQRRDVRQVERATRDLETLLGRRPSEEEVAHRLGCSVATVRRSLDDIAMLREGWAQTLAVPSDSAGIEGQATADCDPFRDLLDTELKEELVAAIGILPQKQQVVLSLYYHEELTMKEIGDVLSVTESRVSQIHSAAVAGLRAHLTSRTAAIAA